LPSSAPLSVQLYSVRDQLAEDQHRTLARLAEIGFRHVEPFGLGSANRSLSERLASARSLRHSLDAVGLTVSAVHAGIPGKIQELAEECAVLGADTAFVPHPRMVPGFDAATFADLEQVDAFADTLNSLARDAAADGLRLGYHNHWFEWAALPDGTTGYDRFWARAADELVAELDVYWATAAGADPAAVLSQLGKRVVSVHLKDGPAEQGAPQTPLGTGKVDIAAALGDDGIRWHVAEIDTTELDPFELLAANTRYLVEAGLSRWS
jgi:sugar phosphate isomerase/epimerase